MSPTLKVNCFKVTGSVLMRNRLVRSVSASISHVIAAVLKAVVTSVVLGACVVAVMHYMGVPVPSPSDIIHSVEKLAKTLS